ncbi:baseplate J/gp47 family protein [Thermoanaerobacterium sp. CMT5567-10]|uniref:baseplate J/gp47 family protein n=1 Tax=Thermoanaerobacterium sp. CMT5567-10 TaxID=3061989 RepID=UPI0026DF9CCB|nr:baseplate J/gp47 family protein [Thermoanaerobacterium sp. CMT5567-10]WKV08208.1 baseplate J/gp47 family protein [Thermoanaerobacterium sp. CMT5567-10]
MADMPEYLNDQTEEEIRQRMLNSIPDNMDKSEGSYIWDAIEPAAIELAKAAIWAQEVLRRGFAETTFGEYLDMRGNEHGIFRREATRATGKVKFTGAKGTIIPEGTIVTTAATENVNSVFFETVNDVVIDDTQTATADIIAVEAGSNGNVMANTINIISSNIQGVYSVTNESPTSGGYDIEDDASFLARYLQKVRNPASSGNKADYVNWTMEVPGVGGVSVVPCKDGPGTVAIAIIDTNKVPASQSLVDAVQDYIAPPWINTVEAENMTFEGDGVSIDGNSIKMSYGTSEGLLRHENLHEILQQPGIWQLRLNIKVDDITRTNDLLQVGIYDLSADSWAKDKVTNGEDAVATFKASDLTSEFSEKIIEFYWDGFDNLELRVTRLTSDNATSVWIDKATYRSTFSKDTGEGKAPVGARVTVQSAIVVLINISVKLVIAEGYNPDSVKSAVIDNIKTYIKNLAFTSDNDVRYVRIGQAILDTTGIEDYQNLTVNGGNINIVIDEQEVAILGEVNFL